MNRQEESDLPEKCKAKTIKGIRCKNNAADKRGYCSQHEAEGIKKERTKTIVISIASAFFGLGILIIAIWNLSLSQTEDLDIKLSGLYPRHTIDLVQHLNHEGRTFTIEVFFECMLTNVGGRDMSLVEYGSRSVDLRPRNSNFFTSSSPKSVYSLEQEPIPLPINLPKGESKRFLIKVMVPVDSTVQTTVDELFASGDTLSRIDLQKHLAKQAGYDLFGNKVGYHESRENNKQWGSYSLESSPRTPSLEVAFISGIGNTFKTVVRYQNGTVGGIFDDLPSSPFVQAQEPTPKATNDPVSEGKTIYLTQCIVCHMPNGEGIPRLHPSLVDSEYVQGDKSQLIRMILHGLTGEIVVNDTIYNGTMPPFGILNDDEQIAQVLTYIRSNFGNKASAIRAEEVARIREIETGRIEPWTIEELISLETDSLSALRTETENSPSSN